MKYNRKEAERRFGHLYEVVPGDSCYYCGLPGDGVDHRPAVHTLHRFAKGRKVTRREIEAQYGQCRLLPCCTICNMGIGSFEGEGDDEYRDEILGFLDFYDDEGPHKGEWNFGTFLAAMEVLEARENGILGDEVYALPLIGRLLMAQALRAMKGEWKDDPRWKPHRERFRAWIIAEPRRRSAHFLAMARLKSYEFLDGVYGRN